MNLDEIRARYSRLADDLATKIDAVPEGKWDEASPCDGWAARDIITHVAESPAMIFKMVGREYDASAAGSDPATAFAASRAQIEAVLADPDVAGTEFDGFFGRTTIAQAIDDFISFDLVIHNWDLSRATGLDERIDPDDVKRLREAAKHWGDAARSPGVFGPEIAVPDDADDQAKLLAFTGRQP
jgi:uncharacterized protein (TIGR03086 family)